MSFYAVKRGWSPGIYDSFDDFAKNIKDFKMPEYEVFEELKEAEEYIDSKSKRNSKQEKKKSKVKPNQILINGERLSHPYSFMHSIDGGNEYSFGAFIKASHTASPVTIKGKSDNEDMIDGLGGKLAGELFAITNIVNKAIEMELKEITIYYNDSKVSEFHGGFFESDPSYIKNYKKFMNKSKRSINIVFIEIFTRTADDGNKLVNKLAREGMEKQRKKAL